MPPKRKLSLEQYAQQRAGRDRARRAFAVTGRVCAECEAVPATDRHHWDGHTHNNTVTNIVFLCSPCHHSFHRPTHCKHGHPLSGPNLRVNPKGRHDCRTCAQARTRRWRERAKLLATGVAPHPVDVPPGVAALIRVRYATGTWSLAGLSGEYGFSAAVVAAVVARTIA